MNENIKKLWHRIKRIPVIGIPYNRLIGNRKVQYIYKDQTKEIKENGLHYLRTINDVLENTPAVYYAYAGTLLGIVRDNRLIKWDLDIDYAVVIDQKFGWEDLEQAMHEKGFKKVREFVFRGKVTEQTYQIDKMKIDFFGQFYRDDYMIQYSYERIESQNYADENQLSVYLVTLPRVNRTKRISVDGVAVPVPDNAEDILKCIYNEDWRIPNPNWKSNSGKCSKLLPNEYGYQSIK